MSYMKTLDMESACGNCGGALWCEPNGEAVCIRCGARTQWSNPPEEPIEVSSIPAGTTDPRD